MKIQTQVKKRARVELMPLIDVVFLLLAFFIYSMLSMSYHSIIPVRLPEASTGEKPRQDETLVIGIEKDGQITITGKNVTMHELRNILLEDAGKSIIYIAGDEEAQYKTIMQVCDLLRQCGITDFAFQVSATAD